MRLPQKLRLKASRDFARVRQEGRSFAGRCLVLAVLRLPVAEVPSFQFGIVTGKKLGKAVVRVRTRRRLREIIREYQHLLVDGLHLVIIPRWRAPDVEFQKLREDFIHTAKKAGILRASE
jgi:ribonuclease P protein component